MKKKHIKKEHWMIILLVLLLSSTLTAFSSKPAGNLNASFRIKFSDYEYYEESVVIDSNTTVLGAVSEYYYVRLDNGSVDCIRNTCTNDFGEWLFFDESGRLITKDYVLKAGDLVYLIYNNTLNVNVTAENDAIKNLLKID
ncbi:MAG TPA: hypothetical protein VI790_01760 [Candidatus Nanoarchaeia archaeon]|nr:hypothetical protein [Candidatus Nanoarchaeia archaeon]